MLRVWLPLNGDLHNQGTSNPSINLVSGNTWASSGKIGNSSLILTKLQTILSTSSCMTGAKEISYSYWVKVNTAWSTNWLDGIRWIETDGSATSTARQEFYTNCTLIGTWYKGGSISGKAFTPGVWTHLAATFNYNTGEAKFYINGILSGTTTNVNTTYYCRGDFYIGDNGIDICENDVRIYDHCLSAAEVREISQGLVLHYKLDQNITVGENIMPNSLNMGLGSANPSTGTWRIAGSNSMTRSRVAINDTPEGNGYGFQNSGIQTPNDGSCYGIDSFPMEANTDYIISMWARITSGTEGYAGFNVYSCTVTGGGWTQKMKNYYVTPLPANGAWTKCWMSYKTNTATTRNIYIGITTGDTDVTTQMCNIHIEKGIINNNNIIEDSSGYNHNGILTNTAFITSNTPRYSNAIYLSKVKINCTNGFPTGENPNFTISFWTKILSTITYVSYGDLIGMYDTGQGGNTFRLELCGSPASNNLMWFRGPSGQSGGGFNMNSSSSSGWFTKDTWHHIVLTGDGINKKYYCYLDGNLCQTYNGSANNWQPTGQWYLGDTAEATAYFSDLRIYCTALDADAIRQLYEVGMKVDNKQNLHAFELVENNSKIQITKQGQVKCNELEEDEKTKFYQTDQIIETNEIIEL